MSSRLDPDLNRAIASQHQGRAEAGVDHFITRRKQKYCVLDGSLDPDATTRKLQVSFGFGNAATPTQSYVRMMKEGAVRLCHFNNSRIYCIS